MSERKSTETKAFGTGRRESHDASAFYDRFVAPEVSSDATLHGPVAALGSGRAICGDARDMSDLPDNSVALVVTSPPYFVGKEYELAVAAAGPGESGIPSTYLDFLDMLHQVFAECVRVLEPGGRIAVNVANLGRKPYRSLSADVIAILQDQLGLLLRGEVIWQKGKSASSSCAWGSFAKAGNPVLRDVTERVIIASKGRFDRAVPVAERKRRDLPHESSLANDEFVDVTRDVWEIDAESASRIGHPAPFPVELPHRLVDLYTYKGDIVLDPFMGSGSTLVAAARRGRVGVGYDLDAEYVELAERRVEAEYKRLSRIQEAEKAEQQTFELQVEVMRQLTPDERQEHFQSRAVRHGKKAQDIALARLEEAGFLVEEKARVPKVGLQFNFKALSEDAAGAWYVDVSGAFTTSRPGLMRTDTLWKMLGRLHVLKSHDSNAKVLVLTSNLPRPGSEGDKALRAVGPNSVFDVIELYDPEGFDRLKKYASGTLEPQEGYWTIDELAEAGY
ncbi:MAG: site-specific DNA-methyltransferase [Acidimicrobiales bacterium]